MFFCLFFFPDAQRKTLLIGDPADIFKEARDWSYRLSARLILRKGLPGPLCRGEPILFFLSLVGEGGTGFPIYKHTKPQSFKLGQRRGPTLIFIGKTLPPDITVNFFFYEDPNKFC